MNYIKCIPPTLVYDNSSIFQNTSPTKPRTDDPSPCASVGSVLLFSGERISNPEC